MLDISWLKQHRCESLTKREGDWLFEFSDSASLRVACLWRLLEAGRIVITSDDHLHQFGLPAPLDSAIEFHRRVGKSSVTSATLREGTLDITLEFSSGHTLEVLPISCGYEAWDLAGNGAVMTAVGGGEVAILS